MVGGLSFWISMWTNPRPTIRAIVNLNPKFGVFYLATIYALQNNLVCSSYWSLGLSFPFYAILLASLVLSPFLGVIWLYFTGWVLYITGKWFRGQAPMSHLRAAAAWSKIPSCISLFMWLILLISDSDMTFIHAVSGPAALFMNFILLILGVWSFVLLIQSVRELQNFSIGKSFLNIVVSELFSFIFLIFIFLIISYLYAVL